MSIHSDFATNYATSSDVSDTEESQTSITIQTKGNSYSLDDLQLYHPLDSPATLRIDGKLFKATTDGSMARERVIRPGVPILEQWDQGDIPDYTANDTEGSLHWTYRGSGVPSNDFDRFNNAVRDFVSRYDASLEALSRMKNESWNIVLERSKKRQEEGETVTSELNNKISADWTQELKPIQEEISVLEAMKSQLGPMILKQFETVFEAQQDSMLSEYEEAAEENRNRSIESSKYQGVVNDWITGAVKDYHVRAHSAIEDLTSFVSSSGFLASTPEGKMFRTDTWTDDRKDRDYQWVTLDKDIKTGWGSETFVPRTLQEFKRLLKQSLIHQRASKESSRA